MNATMKSAGKKVLITGGTGLLGVPLLSHLRARGHAVVAQGRGSKQSDLVFDLCDPEATHRSLDTLRPEVIVNLVALTNVDQCEEKRQLAYRMNVQTVETLVDWIETGSRETSLVHISTDQVYDGPGEKTERQVTLGNTYAFSKFCAEQVVARVHGTSLRTNFFGRSQVAGRKSFSDWIIETLSRGDQIKLFPDIFFSPLSLTTLCGAIGRVVERPVPGVYNLGSRDGMSKAEFAMRLAAAFNLSTDSAVVVPSETARLLAPRPSDMRMDCGLFERTFSVGLPSLAEEIVSVKGEYELQEPIRDQEQDDQPGEPDVLHRGHRGEPRREPAKS